MKLRTLLVTIAILACNASGFSQNNEGFTPSGRPMFKIFSNYHSTFSDGKTLNAFEITRAYLGYQHSFSQNWSGKLILDVGNPKDNGGHEMAAYVKNAMLSYRKDALSVNFGLISTTSFKTMERFWGYRYMLKSFQDEFKFGSSADIGINAVYQFNDIISADLIIMNGEGYKKIEADSIFAVGAGITLKPVDGLVLRAYYETTTREEYGIKRQNTMSFFLGYAIESFSIGAEYNDQSNNKKTQGMDWNGYSAYTSYRFDKSKIFVRVDKLDSKGSWNMKTDGTHFIAGAEFNPVKGVKITPNYRHYSTDVIGGVNVDQLFVNCEINF